MWLFKIYGFDALGQGYTFINETQHSTLRGARTGTCWADRGTGGCFILVETLLGSSVEKDIPIYSWNPIDGYIYLKRDL